MFDYQYDMFHNDPTDLELIQEECRETRMFADKLRRSFFARMNEQFKLICELRQELDKIKNPINMMGKTQGRLLENSSTCNPVVAEIGAVEKEKI